MTNKEFNTKYGLNAHVKQKPELRDENVLLSVNRRRGVRPITNVQCTPAYVDNGLTGWTRPQEGKSEVFRQR